MSVRRALRSLYESDISDESGASAVEYAIVLGLIAAVCILAITSMGLTTASLFEPIEAGFSQ